MTGLQDGINSDIGWCVAGGLGTGFDGDAYGITIDIGRVIEIVFSDRYFDGCNYSKLKGIVIVFQDGIDSDVSLYIYSWLCTDFDGDSDGITLDIDEVI